MTQKEIRTSVSISAEPEEIWKVLTDFDNYPHWNPFIKSVKGVFLVGRQVEVLAGGLKFRPNVLVFEEQKEIRWRGKLFIKGLFDGEHIFKIVDNGDGTSLFRQEEIFTGLLVRFLARKVETDTKEDFEKMNEALKTICERNS